MNVKRRHSSNSMKLRYNVAHRCGTVTAGGAHTVDDRRSLQRDVDRPRAVQVCLLHSNYRMSKVPLSFIESVQLFGHRLRQK